MGKTAYKKEGKDKTGWVKNSVDETEKRGEGQTKLNAKKIWHKQIGIGGDGQKNLMQKNKYRRGKTNG